MRSKEVKKCTIVRHRDWKYGWLGVPTCCCIMAVALDHTVRGRELDTLFENNELSEFEFDAITNLDWDSGTDEDVKLIRKIAKRYNVEIIIHQK